MPTRTITTEEHNALLAERDTLLGALRVVTVERHLLQERLKAYLCQLFAANSEARGDQSHDELIHAASA